MESAIFRLPGVRLIKPRLFSDERGYFLESYRQSSYEELGLPDFVQDNISFSKKQVLRGLHFQKEPGQAKLVQVLRGKIFDVAVDLRSGSETFGEWESFELDDELRSQLFIPAGFAHGFCVLSEEALVHYKVSTLYDPKTECSLRWNDPHLSVNWPIDNPILSERDQKSPFLRDLFS